MDPAPSTPSPVRAEGSVIGPASEKPGGSARPWFAMGLGGILLLAETAILERAFGDTILQLATDFFVRRPYRKEIVIAAALAAAAVAVRVWSRPALFRDGKIAPGRLALQGLAFLALASFAAWVGTGRIVPGLSDVAVPRVAMALVAGWLLSLPLLVPAGAPAGDLAKRAALAVALVTGAIVSGEVFWNVTGEWTLRLVSWMLERVVGVTVVRPEPMVIGTPDFKVSVGFGCSGYQGIALITMLLSGYLWWFRDALRFPRALVLIPVGIVLSYLANALRIAALIMVGIRISPQIAVDGFHSNAGWLAFLVIGLGMIWATSRMPFFLSPVAAGPASPAPGPRGPATALAAEVGNPAADTARHAPSTTACLLPFLALLGITLVTGAFSAHGRLDLLYPVRVLAVAAVLWSLRREYPAVSFDPSWTAIGLGGLVFAIWMVLAPNVTDPDPEAAALLDPTALGPLWGPAWVVVRLFGYVVTVPIAEELAFRGFLARRLVSDDPEGVPLGTFTWLSFLGSSLAFGLLHQSAWIPGTIAGAAYALALYQRRRIGDCIAAHATTNALLGTYVIATGSWGSWG